MNKLIKLIAVVGILASQGCASFIVAKGSQEKLKEKAIIARPMGENGVQVGVDLFALDTLKERPLLQAGAAIVDVGLAYAAYDKWGKSDRGNNEDEPEYPSAVAGQNVVNVSGVDNGSTVNVNIGNTVGPAPLAPEPAE